MTTYKHTRASILASAQKGNSPKDQYIDLFQHTLDEQFYNASNWWTVSEETALGSQVYTDVDVRIAHLINAETGLKMGDDWKTILFKDITHPVELGKQYVFDNSTWLTINTEILKNLTATATIRRCNNTLRWIDEPTGAYYEEPCAIEYMVKEARNYATQGSPFITPGGFLKIYVQLNERTGKINENQRYLFGNAEHWTCYKVIGTGLNDFRNDVTFDNTSGKVLVIDLIADFINEELDDIVNGICDVQTNVYNLTLSASAISGSPLGSHRLYASVLYNGKTVDRPIEWTTSSSAVATVSGSSLMGTVLFTAGSVTGSAVITANIKNNTTSASCLVTTSASPTANKEIQISPDKNYVLEGKTETYAVYLYSNGVQQADTFTFSCNGSSVPSANYTFTQVDGNHFSVKNILRDVSSYLIISCVCASGSITRTYNINLQGAWQFDIK